MRVLVDACVDPRIVEGLAQFDVKTAAEANLHRLKDHELVKRLQGTFDVLITNDKGFEHQHNLKRLQFGIVIIHLAKNKIEFYRPLFPSICAAVESVKPGEVKHVRGSVPP